MPEQYGAYPMTSPVSNFSDGEGLFLGGVAAPVVDGPVGRPQNALAELEDDRFDLRR